MRRENLMKKSIMLAGVFMATILVGCGSAGGASIPGLSAEEKEAIAAVDSLMEAFESQDVESINKILFVPENYEDRNEKIQNSIETFSHCSYIDKEREKVDIISVHRGFVNAYPMFLSGPVYLSAMDYLKFDFNACEYVGNELIRMDKEDLQINQEYLRIVPVDECMLYYKKGLQKVPTTVAEYAHVDDENAIECAYAIEVDYDYYWGKDLLGFNIEEMQSVLGEHSSIDVQKEFDRFNDFTKRNVVAYKYNGQWYVLIDYNNNNVGAIDVEWGDQTEEE